MPNKVNKSDIFVSVAVLINEKVRNINSYLDWLITLPMNDCEILLLLKPDENVFSICKKYSYKDSRIKLFELEGENITLSQLKNLAIRKAQGKYMMFLNYGDRLEGGALKSMRNQVEIGDADVVLCDFKFSLRPNENQVSSLEEQEIRDLHPLRKFSRNTLPNHIFNLLGADILPCLIRTGLIRKNKLLFEEVNCNNSLFGMYIMLLAEKIIYLNQPLVKYMALRRLEYKDYATYELLFEKIKDFEKVLAKYNKDDFLTRSFLNKILEILWRATDLLFGPGASLSKDFLFEQIFEHFKFREHGTAFYYSELCKRLVATDYEKPAYLTTLKKLLKSESKTNICPIVLNSVNNLDICNAAVVIESIKKHCKKDSFYDIYLLCNDKTTKTVRRCFESMSQENVRVSFITDFNEKYIHKGDLDLRHCALYVPSILDCYNKILALSLNVVAQADISEIFETDLSDKAFALSVDVRSTLMTKYKRDDNKILYSTAVILFNVPYWNENKLLDVFEDNKKDTAPENIDADNQDASSLHRVINNNYYDYIQNLNAVWNVQYLNNVVSYNFNSPLLKSAKILNYAAEKPWINPQIYLADVWWSYAKNTPLYELIVYSNICRIVDIGILAGREQSLLQEQGYVQQRAIQQNVARQDDNQKMFNELVETLDKDIGNIWKRQERKQANDSVYIKKINDDDNIVYPLMKQYLKLWLKYIFSYGKRRRNIKTEMEHLQANITKNLLK